MELVQSTGKFDKQAQYHKKETYDLPLHNNKNSRSRRVVSRESLKFEKCGHWL